MNSCFPFDVLLCMRVYIVCECLHACTVRVCMCAGGQGGWAGLCIPPCVCTCVRVCVHIRAYIRMYMCVCACVRVFFLVLVK